MRLHLKTAFWHGLILTGMILGAFVVVAPFWAVFMGSDIDLGPVRVLATTALVCLYGWTAVSGIEIRGSRPHASLLSSLVVALSGVGLVFGLLAVWPVGTAADHPEARWGFATGLIAATLVALAAGMLRRSLER